MFSNPVDLSQNSYGRFKVQPGGTMETMFTRTKSQFEKRLRDVGEQPAPFKDWETRKQEFLRRVDSYKV